MLDVSSLKEAISVSPLGVVALPEPLRREVAYTKFESQDPNVSDTQHGPLWVEMHVTHPSLGLSEEDGCIATCHGAPRGEVALTPDNDMISAEQAEQREANGARHLPRYLAYDFRLVKVVKTNGPTLRSDLLESMEAKKAQAETKMFDGITAAFNAVVARLEALGQPLPPEAQKMLQEEDGELEAVEEGTPRRARK